MAGLGTAVEAHHGVGVPATSEGIDEMSFPTVSESKPEHRCIMSRAHWNCRLTKQPFPPSGVPGGLGRTQRGYVEQGRIVLDRSQG